MGFFKNASTEWKRAMTENDLDQMQAQVHTRKNWPSVAPKNREKSNGTIKRVPYEFYKG